jgi:hypothetical protein
MLPKSVHDGSTAVRPRFDGGGGRSTEEFKLTVPTYYGTAHCKQNVVDLPDFDSPNVPVLIHEAEGVRIVLGTHDFNDMDKPDIQIERRPKGWAIFLHPVGGGDASGYVYFLDDGRSFLLKEDYWAGSNSIEVLRGHKEPPEIDELDLPEPDIRGTNTVEKSSTGPGLQAAHVQGHPGNQPVQALTQKLCARCGQLIEYCDDWYGDLCPGCADESDGHWVCRNCGRHDTFEVMGGDGATNPECCGIPCLHVDPDESAA